MTENKTKTNQEKIRLNKYLALAGLCSRREADEWIEAGRVTVNGEMAKPGQKIRETDSVLVNGKSVSGKEDTVVLAYYKPVGVTCTSKDVHARKTVIEALKYPIRLTYAGRLDKDSEGLLIMTNDGDLIEKLMTGRYYHEKEYVVKIEKEITEDFLQKMAAGLYLPELKQTTRPCEVKKLGKYTFSICLTQGLNRQIRRMCKVLGADVKSLKRVRIGQITLEQLKPGEYRKMNPEEIPKLFSKASDQ